MKIIAVVTLLLCTSAHAHPEQRSEQQRPEPPRHRGPPPEALDACKGKAAGSAVEMKTPRGDTVKGTCRMVLVPERDGPGEER